MDEMGIELQNLFWALSGSAGSAKGEANGILEPFSSFLGGLKDKSDEIPLIGQKGGDFGSLNEEKGIETWEASWKQSPFLFFPKDSSLTGIKRPGVDQLPIDMTSPSSRKKDFPLDLSPFGEKKNDPTQDEIPTGILENLLGPGELPGEVSRGKGTFPFRTRLSEAGLWNLKGLSLGEGISQLNSPTCGIEVSGVGPAVREEYGLLVLPQKAISSSPVQVREPDGLCDAISGVPHGVPGEKGRDDSAVSSLGSWAQIHGRGETEQWNRGPFLTDPDGLAHVVGLRVEGPRGPFFGVRGPFSFGTQNGEGAQGQEAILALGGKEATKLDTSLGVFEVADFSLSVIENSEALGEGTSPWGPPLGVDGKQPCQPGVAFGGMDSKTDASEEGSPPDNDFSVSTQALRTQSAEEDSCPELSRFPGITEEKRSRGELATLKGPRREGPSIKREELGQTSEIRPLEPGSPLFKEGPLLSQSKDETSQVNGSQRLLHPHGRELGEGPFQTVQIVFKEAEDLTRIRLRLHQNNLDALFVVTSAEKKSELEANLGQLQTELSQSGFLPQLAVEVGGRYANSGFQKDPPFYFHQEAETGCHDTHEEILRSGWDPVDGSIHLRV